MITKNQARKLAIRYSAYSDASLEHDPQGVLVWGGMLAEIQREIGVEMAKQPHLDRIVKMARAKLSKMAA